MANVKLGSAGVTSREIDLSGPVSAQPIGTPCGVIGTSLKGPAFVPVTVGLIEDYYAKFGKTDGQKFGPLAVTEWLRSAQAVTYLRVLGVGQGLKRETGTNAGRVLNAGFVAGEQLPNVDSGILTSNPYANSGGSLGRVYMIGCFMSESLGSSIFSSASLQGVGSVTPGVSTAVPMLRGVLMAPSGVIVKLSSSFTASAAPASTLVATNVGSSGSPVGTVVLASGKQEFVLLLNGHKGTDAAYPNVYTASFDSTAPNYFKNVLNSDPYKLQQAGHYLYAYWDIHPALAVVTGSGLISSASSAGNTAGLESAAFILTGSLGRDVGSASTPNYENWEDRFSHAKSPWVLSQRFGGTPKALFRFHMIDDGAGNSNKVKISIENIAPSSDSQNPYGTFDVVVREWNDTDVNPRTLEQYRGLSLNPSADRYIAKSIGDMNVFYDFDKTTQSQKLVVDGNYPNASNYVRVELDDLVVNGEVDSTALPIGFRGIAHLVTSGSAPLAAITSIGGQSDLIVADALKRVVQPPVPFRLSLQEGEGVKALVNSSLYWGVQFEQVISVSNPNATSVKNDSLASYTLYFPNFQTSNLNFLEEGSVGVADSASNGILDVDRFCNNKFTLENIRVMTGSDAKADPQKWSTAVYVRDGNIAANAADKTRALAIGDFTQPNRKYLKFTMLTQGGFDGTNMFDREEAAISNVAVTADMADSTRGQSAGASAAAYRKAIDIMSERTDVDIQLLAIPGIRHAIVTDKAIESVERRFDAMYIMDIEEYDTNGSLITGSIQVPSVINTTTQFKTRALNNSFGAAYYPDVVITDPTTKSNVMVPSSVVVLGAFALNDAKAYPWFAPAGFDRGALASTLETKVKLSKDNMDTLYDANINPLVAFPGNTPAGTQAQGGVVVWGQRTLQAFASSLDRVNVRRLMIDLRRQVRDIALTFVFEPNRESTLARFQATVEPRLSRIQKQFGVERYKVQIDTGTTTQADVENNTIRGKIWVQPTHAIEYVALDFVVTNAGAQI